MFFFSSLEKSCVSCVFFSLCKPNHRNCRCKVQLLADAAAAGRGTNTIRISDAEAEATFKHIGRSSAGWFSGLPEFQMLEAREGRRWGENMPSV